MKKRSLSAKYCAAVAASAAMLLSAAAWSATVSPADEASVISQLNAQGYIDVSSYQRDASGDVSVKAVNAATGALVSAHVDPNGKIAISAGWPPQNPWHAG